MPVALETFLSQLSSSGIVPEEKLKVVVSKKAGFADGEALARDMIKSRLLTKYQAEDFYAVHKARPFFNDLVKFMISGPVLVQVLEGENAILKNRDIMGATNPKEALPGTIRADFAASIDENAVHGSDAVDTAQAEIAFFFKPEDIFSR